MTTTDAIVIEPGTPAKASMILLHGLGATGDDLLSLTDFWPVANLPTRFILPHAPMRPVTLNAGMMMPAWYDITGLDLGNRQDEEGVKATCERITTLLDGEVARGIPSNKIVLAGFSQGGAVALYTGLRYPQRLAGIIGMSCYLPLPEKLALEANAANQHVPLFLGHGRIDDVVSIKWGEMTRDYLQQAHYQPDWHAYNVAHGIDVQEIQDIKTWLGNIGGT